MASRVKETYARSHGYSDDWFFHHRGVFMCTNSESSAPVMGQVSVRKLLKWFVFEQ